MKQKHSFKRNCLLLFALAIGLHATGASAAFDSGSDGSDGALLLDTPGVFIFDRTAFSPELDADGDGIFNFTSITIAAGVTVKFSQGPMVWLASDDVQIEGVLDLSGEDGNDSSETAVNAMQGPGGFAGGIGCTTLTPPQNGFGPGGGNTAFSRGGGGGGYAVDGQAAHSGGSGGSSYGNDFILPMIGGSGGAGGDVGACANYAGGGAGGGAILIAGSKQVSINGSIIANGGNGGDSQHGSTLQCGGGGGSGGAIRIISQDLTGTGVLSATGGVAVSEHVTCETKGMGSHGRIRLESIIYSFSGTFGSPVLRGFPGVVFLSPDVIPVRVTSIGGVPVPDTPSGGIDPADLVINESGSAVVEIEAHGIPLGTVVQLTLLPELSDPITADSTPLAGTEDTSTASASVLIPHGLTRFYITANWTP